MNKSRAQAVVDHLLETEYRFHDHDETVPISTSQKTPRGQRPRIFGPSSQKTADHVHQTGDIYPEGSKSLMRSMRRWQKGIKPKQA